MTDDFKDFELEIAIQAAQEAADVMLESDDDSDLLELLDGFYEIDTDDRNNDYLL